MNALDKNNLHCKPQYIWNMDETGMALEYKPTTCGQ